jgi:hypothetical protein
MWLAPARRKQLVGMCGRLHVSGGQWDGIVHGPDLEAPRSSRRPPEVAPPWLCATFARIRAHGRSAGLLTVHPCPREGPPGGDGGFDKRRTHREGRLAWNVFATRIRSRRGSLSLHRRTLSLATSCRTVLAHRLGASTRHPVSGCSIETGGFCTGTTFEPNTYRIPCLQSFWKETSGFYRGTC